MYIYYQFKCALEYSTTGGRCQYSIEYYYNELTFIIKQFFSNGCLARHSVTCMDISYIKDVFFFFKLGSTIEYSMGSTDYGIPMSNCQWSPEDPAKQN